LRRGQKTNKEFNTFYYIIFMTVKRIGLELVIIIVLLYISFGIVLFITQKRIIYYPDKQSFEQCAGFLRINDGENPLDNSAVHPERYSLVKKMANDLGTEVKELIGTGQLNQKLNLSKYVTNDLGLPTLEDILKELEKPARDPRKLAKVFEFDQRVRKPEDLQVGMILPGIVTNITAFGAFVDVGVKQDGLVHVSEMADKFVKDPMEVVSLHQPVTVKVLEVDLQRKRIAFSMKGLHS
jgi:uncharacterized protein